MHGATETAHGGSTAAALQMKGKILSIHYLRPDSMYEVVSHACAVHILEWFFCF